MSPGVPPDDAELLTRLGGVARAVDPVPPGVREQGRAVFALRRLDDELAALVADSELGLVGVRAGPSEVRLLSFAAGSVLVEAQVSTGSVLVQVVAATGELPDGGTVELAGVVHGLDEQGSARFDTAPPGPVRLVVELPGAARVTTSWFHP